MSSERAARARESVTRGVHWLLENTQNGTTFPSAPIGLYFARLWYYEKLYPIIWTLGALQHAASVLIPSAPEAPAGPRSPAGLKPTALIFGPWVGAVALNGPRQAEGG